MRNLQLEAVIWNLVSSQEFFEATACECEATMKWFGELAVKKQISSLGRNNQIFDIFKQRAADFRRGAELARFGDYQLIWRISDSIRGDVKGVMEQPLHSWMTDAEYREFSSARIDRLLHYSEMITQVLNNAFTAADSFFDPDPDCPDRSEDDDGFPGDEIILDYNSCAKRYPDSSIWALPDPLPEYAIDRSVACRTGEEVPWTGVWYPAVGLEGHSLTFAIKGLRMQPAFRVLKTRKEFWNEGAYGHAAETSPIVTTWHPLIVKQSAPDTELWSKAGQPCPKAGMWQPTDPGVSPRIYQVGETMANLGSTYGHTVWRWIAER